MRCVSRILINGYNAVLLTLMFACRCSCSSLDSTGSSHYDLAQEKRFYDKLEPTVFSPSGSLHAVERIFEEATSDVVGLTWKKLKEDFLEHNKLYMPGRLVIGLVCRDFVCVVSMDQLGLRDVYNPSSTLINDITIEKDNTNVTTFGEKSFIPSERDFFGADNRSPSFVKLDKTIAAISAGDPIDSTILLRRIEDIAFSMHKANGIASGEFLLRLESSILAADISQKLADTLQASTQSVGSKAGKMLASSALIFGTTGKASSQKLCLWRIDPTGQLFSADVASIGRGAGYVERQILEQILKHKNKDNIGKVDDEKYCWLLSNEDVESFLHSLSVKEACELAKDCFQRSTLQFGEPIENENAWWDRIQCTLIELNISDDDYVCRYLSGPDMKRLLESEEEPFDS